MRRHPRRLLRTAAEILVLVVVLACAAIGVAGVILIHT